MELQALLPCVEEIKHFGEESFAALLQALRPSGTASETMCFSAALRRPAAAVVTAAQSARRWRRQEVDEAESALVEGDGDRGDDESRFA